MLHHLTIHITVNSTIQEYFSTVGTATEHMQRYDLHIRFLRKENKNSLQRIAMKRYSKRRCKEFQWENKVRFKLGRPKYSRKRSNYQNENK